MKNPSSSEALNRKTSLTMHGFCFCGRSNSRIDAVPETVVPELAILLADKRSNISLEIDHALILAFALGIGFFHGIQIAFIMGIGALRLADPLRYIVEKF